MNKDGGVMKCQFCDFETPNKIALANHWDNVHKTPLQPDIDTLSTDFLFDGSHRGGQDLSKIKQAIYSLLASEAVVVIPNFGESFEAVPLSKLKELMGVAEK